MHNNPAELGARARVRKRDISFGPRTNDGTRAWDTFMALAATSKKLDVNFHRYVFDRVSATNAIPPLAEIAKLDLGASWRHGPQAAAPAF